MWDIECQEWYSEFPLGFAVPLVRLTMASLSVHEIVKKNSIVFGDKDTDILLVWDGGIGFEVYAGRFDGSYDCIDSFYKKVSDINGARACAELWYRENSLFNPGP